MKYYLEPTKTVTTSTISKYPITGMFHFHTGLVSKSARQVPEDGAADAVQVEPDGGEAADVAVLLDVARDRPQRGQPQQQQ